MSKAIPVNFDFLKSKLNARQVMTLNRLPSDKKKLEYLVSFLGIKTQVDSKCFKSLSVDSKEKPNLTYVHNERNYFLNMLERQYGNEKPYSDAVRFVGVEIECFLKRDDFEVECSCECSCNRECSECGNEHDVDCDGSCRDNCDCDYRFDSVMRSLKRAKIRNVAAKHDGSLNSNDDYEAFGVEFSVIMREGEYSTLEKLCKWLEHHDAWVNTSCGLHVHLDYRYLDSKSDVLLEAERFNSAMTYLTDMLPKSRRNNSYCKNGIGMDGDRYRKVNMCSFEKHGTLEIRAHSGTVNFEKIKKWINILLAIKNTRAGMHFYSLETCLIGHGVDADVMQYALSRAEKFAGRLSTPQDTEIECDDAEVA